MFSMLRWLFVLLLCLAGIGLYRGWFSLSSPSSGTENNKINVSVSVDKNKLKDDVGKAEKKIAEEVEQLAGKAKAEET
jgi:hypothetical protein